MAWKDIKAEEAYEKRELESFHLDLTKIRQLPSWQRANNFTDFVNAADAQPKMVAERTRWLIDGNYGAGAAIFARNIMRQKPIQNAVRELLAATMALEWNVPAGRLEEALRHIDPSPKAKILRLIGLDIGKVKFEERAEVKRIRAMEFKATASAQGVSYDRGGYYEKLKRTAGIWLTISDAWLEAGYPREARRAAIQANAHHEVISEPRRIGVSRDVFREQKSRKRRRR